MKIYSTENIQGQQYEAIGLVSGSTVQSKSFLSDFGQSLKNFVGGELRSYSDMMNKARQEAIERMIEKATDMGADAIVGVRFSTSAIMEQAAEIMVYGTAVRFV